MTREQILEIVSDAVNAEFAHKHDNDSIVNADWIEIREAIASRVADKLAHLTLNAEERETIAWLKQLLGSIAYRVEPRRGPALDLLTRLLGATP